MANEIIDIFNTDAFGVESLSRLISQQPFTPGLIGSLGLFEEEGITTRQVAVEIEGQILSLVQSQPYGAPVPPVIADKRSLRSFVVPHLPTAAAIKADEVIGVRAPGLTTPQTVEMVLAKRLRKMRANLEATIEYHRARALNGVILDKDGSTILDIFSAFGVVQNTVDFVLDNADTNVLAKCAAALDAMETELGGVPFSGAVGLCGKTFWEDFLANNTVRATYLNWAAASALRADPREAFDFGGITWMRYRGKVGSTAYVDDTAAFIVPKGVDGLLVTYYAPADYLAAVGELGLSMYAAAELQDFAKGIDLEAQSNALSLCTRPRAIIQATV